MTEDKKNHKEDQETVLVICAHNDDQIIGVGGTLAKYAKEGKQIITIIFSYGQKSHPHLQEEVIIKKRVRESLSANKILGGEKSQIYYLGLEEGKFYEEFKQKKLLKKLKNIIKKSQPGKIFTHSIDDPHPDHRDVYRIVMELFKTLDYKGDVYSFNVWNLFINFRKRNKPKLVVDVTDTFNEKIEAFKRHKSQVVQARLPLMWSLYFRALLNGLLNGTKYVEIFYKIK